MTFENLRRRMALMLQRASLVVWEPAPITVTDEHPRKQYWEYPENEDKGVRSKYRVGGIKVNAAVCHKCGGIIRSKNRHDFVACSCGNISVTAALGPRTVVSEMALNGRTL